MKRILVLALTLSLVVTGLCSMGWAGADNSFGRNDSMLHGWSIMDVLIARPLGVCAGIVGSAIFVVSLPFTIPAGGVRDAADIFIVQPFQFSFVRQFPDEDI